MSSKSNQSSLQTGTTNAEDSFYDTIEGSSPDNDNTLNQHSVSLQPNESALQEDQWKTDLVKLEDEIQTLKTVLNTKVREATELKRKLGITTMVELKQDFQHGITAIKESESVQKTNEKLQQFGETISSTEAYQKTNAAFKTFGAFASKKLGDLRNSNAYKSVEDKVGGAYSSIKTQLSGSQSVDEFGEEAAQTGSEEAAMTDRHVDDKYK